MYVNKIQITTCLMHVFIIIGGVSGQTATTPVAALSQSILCSVEDRKSERPNVLFISLDDLNDWVGCLDGHPNALTPNIDRLAKKGVLFTNAYSSSPLCGPSRAAFLSGMRASTTGFYDNKGEYTKNQALSECENLLQFFKRQGYATYGAGKIFHGYYPQFWDDSIGFGARMYQAGDPKINQTDIPGIFDWGVIDRTDEEMDDYKMAQFTIDKLNQKHDKPFFLACGIYLPHAPWYAPQKYFDKFPLGEIEMPTVKSDDLDDIPVVGQRIAGKGTEYNARVDKYKSRHNEAVQAYLAACNFADAQVGRILEALENSEYANNTIVVLFGDHGVHLGEKMKWHKDTLWVESARAPMIIYAPGYAGNGRQCSRTVSLLDMYPTLVDLINGKIGDKLEGNSLVPLLENTDLEWNHPAITNRRKDQTSVRTEQWCYIRYEDGSEELYDIVNDPSEWNNLASDPSLMKVKVELAEHIPKDPK
jgi:arylsulfatase A-like enzyme